MEKIDEIIERSELEIFAEGLIEVSLKTIKVGEEIYISTTNTTKYEVLDIGDPFILILDTKTHFAHLYKASKIYKKK